MKYSRYRGCNRNKDEDRLHGNNVDNANLSSQKFRQKCICVCKCVYIYLWSGCEKIAMEDSDLKVKKIRGHNSIEYKSVSQVQSQKGKRHKWKGIRKKKEDLYPKLIACNYHLHPWRAKKALCCPKQFKKGCKTGEGKQLPYFEIY